jgi:HK97 gp10 family phage protein
MGMGFTVHTRPAKHGVSWRTGEAGISRPGPGITVEGVDEIERWLKSIKVDLSHKKMIAGMRKAANVVRDAISAEAPVFSSAATVPWAKGGHGRAGKLRDDIQVRKHAKGGPADFKVGPSKDTAWSAFFVHEGHRIRRPYRRWGEKSPKGKSKAGPVVGRVAGNPFIERAAIKSKDEAVEATRRYLAKAVRRWKKAHGVT